MQRTTFLESVEDLGPELIMDSLEALNAVMYCDRRSGVNTALCTVDKMLPLIRIVEMNRNKWRCGRTKLWV